MKIKLKPCPFCGAKADYDENMGVILCSDCAFYYEVPTNIKEIAPLWNRRPSVEAGKEDKGEKI